MHIVGVNIFSYNINILNIYIDAQLIYPMETRPKIITINFDQQEWLEKHPDFNLSGFVRMRLYERMKEAKP